MEEDALNNIETAELSPAPQTQAQVSIPTTRDQLILREFIYNLECVPELWDSSSSSYKNNIKRGEALGKLLEIYKKKNQNNPPASENNFYNPPFHFEILYRIINLNELKFQAQNNVALLPKFEDCTDVSNQTSLLEQPKVEEYSFNWQEKVFSRWEIQRYNDIHNCLTETELNYHQTLAENDIEPSKIFSCVHDDYYFPLPQVKRETEAKNSILSLNMLMKRLNMIDYIDEAVLSSTSSMGRLFRSEENVSMKNEEWTAMHIVFDKSDYNEDSQLLLKQEAKLVSLYYNQIHKYLIISPNVNNLELNPYTVEPMLGVQWPYQYSVEVELDENGGEELVEFLKKLYKKWEKKHSQLVKFITPAYGRTQCYVSFDIQTATGFEYKNLYVEYTVKVPDMMECSSEVHGKTHVTSALMLNDDEEVWHFGHVVDLELLMDDDTKLSPVKIFLEAISIDWSGRHRTEGYCYLPLTLEPGRYRKSLSCSRPEEKDRVDGESRRFFVGGCNLIKELDVLAEPQLYDTDFTFTNTGIIVVEYSIISQSHIPGHPQTAHPDLRAGSSSDVLQGAEAVLRKYRKARARLQAVTKDLRNGSGDG